MVEMRLPPNFPAQMVSDQLTAAFTGGSNYWLQSAVLMKADRHPTVKPWYSDATMYEGSFEILLGFDDPDGWEGNGAGRKTITDTDVQRGIDVMRRDYPDQYTKVVDGTCDIDTADVFLQCAMFGRVIYG